MNSRSGEIQALVSSVWSEILGLQEVAPDENFFDAGGTSILASRLAARLRSRLERTVGVNDVFLAPTVRAMTERLVGGTEPVPAAPLNSRILRQRESFQAFRALRDLRAVPGDAQ